jgi:UDP-N-acetylmuramoyl-L-alanyl-D-glutamate--2,6-diaminopimelate ligase
VDERAKSLLDWLRSRGLDVTSLACDSRSVTPGDVFLAYPGAQADGRAFIGDAIVKGASAVLWEREGFSWNPAWKVPQRALENLRGLSGPLAHEVYGRPSERLWTMGVTGTNGKTSCSQWIAQACTLSGARTAVVGTLGIGFPAVPGGAKARLAPNPNTTPEPITLHRSLARLLEEGAQGVAMEVSSIALEQERTAGTVFGAALFTNLSRDHLDYHGDMESYARAKQKLFVAPGLRHAVLNMDDVQGVHIARELSGSGIQRVAYSTFEGVATRAGLECFVEARDVAVTAEGIRFTAATSWGEAAIHSRLIGRFNVSNLLGVLGMMLASGVPFDRATAALARLSPVPGRMQRFGGGGRPLVVVDYAHTPDALEQTLSALKDVAHSGGGQLIAVFGCGGERDRGKRPLMGAVASRHADRVVLTSDNPRSEQPEAILADIIAGMAVDYEALPDRREALAKAIGSAGAGDVVLVAGKGHEPYQEIAGVKRPYSDLEEAQRVLEGWKA